MSLREDAIAIALTAVKGSLPYENTLRQLKALPITGTPIVIAAGKAAVPMAKAAAEVFGSRLKAGLVITKYGHLGDFACPGFDCIEAGHPVSDANSVLAAEKALALAYGLQADDTLLFLVSGGGSALMEKSKVPAQLQREVTEKLLARGAAIEEINAIRKRLSLVKGGRLAAAAYPAKVITLALSDVLTNEKGAIASGPTVPDDTPEETIREIAGTYLPDLPALLPTLLQRETLTLNDGGYYFVGDINILCETAKTAAEAHGYRTQIINRALTGEARDAANAILTAIPQETGKRAYIYAGETTVTLKGHGLGGRNQEMALTAAIGLRGRAHICFLSMGSDGTDGPTDAAGGFADGGTCGKMLAAGITPEAALEENDSYRALKAAGDLLVTGATGTNVNDITVVLTDA